MSDPSCRPGVLGARRQFQPRQDGRPAGGHDPYRPSERRQRRILRSDPSRAQVVAGAPATVAELRQQWRDTTIAGSPLDFARFVTRRAVLALERVEYRLLGPEYKSPRLVKPEMLASARFRAGLEKIPGASVEKAGRSSTRWPQGGADCRWTCCPPGIGRCSSAASIRRSTMTSRRSR